MNQFIDQHYQELLEKEEEEVEKLQAKLTKVTSLIPKLMICWSPSPICAIFLREQFLNYQMTCIMRDRSPLLNEPLDFSQDFHSSHAAIQNLLCELFLHNLEVPNDRVCNPLLYVGDIQLRALMSWIQNEISWESQAKVYRELEEEIPLYLRLEAKDPKTYYYVWLKIAPLDYGS